MPGVSQAIRRSRNWISRFLQYATGRGYPNHVVPTLPPIKLRINGTREPRRIPGVASTSCLRRCVRWWNENEVRAAVDVEQRSGPLRANRARGACWPEALSWRTATNSCASQPSGRDATSGTTPTAGGRHGADELPRVNGRHRKRVGAGSMRSGHRPAHPGCTYEQITADLGYAKPRNRLSHHSNALAEREDEAVDNLRFLERERLDALQAALWDKAMSGEVKPLSRSLASSWRGSICWGL